jgi:hypothetical protein
MLSRRSMIGWLGALAGGAAATAAVTTAAKSAPTQEVEKRPEPNVLTLEYCEICRRPVRAGAHAHTFSLRTSELPSHTHTITIACPSCRREIHG